MRAVLNNIFPEIPHQSVRKIILLAAVIFLTATGVRLLHWQDRFAESEAGGTFFADIDRPYRADRQRMIEDGSLLFPNRPMVNGDARMILHPPGYAILRLWFDKTISDSTDAFRLFHIFSDSAAAVLVFLIAAELFPLVAACIGGLLVAFSPHLAYYSLWFTPDSIAVLPVLAAIYLVIKASKRPRWWIVLLAGGILGLSCWFRSNALMLAPFIAVTFFVMVERGKRWRYAATFVAAAILVISPITIRNWVTYGRFVPTSIGAGLNLIEGIGDYDREGRFGMVQYDNEVKAKDVVWHNRPDYGSNLWSPEGIERDRYRFSRAAEVIRQNPGWFLGVMIRRAGFMLRYNDGGESRWPFGTSQVAVISATPPFGNRIPTETQPVWSNQPAELLANGTLKSSAATTMLVDDGRALQISTDTSAFTDQFISAPIAVEKHTDYVLTLPITVTQSVVAVKITSDDQRIALASALTKVEKRGLKKKGKQAPEASDEDEETEPADEPATPDLLIRFASEDRNQVRLVVSNDSPAQEPPIVKIGQIELVALGATPNQWTRWPRRFIRGVQKNIFTTSRLLPLVLIGIALLGFVKRWPALAILLAVPIYYLSVQSLLHTEYRYILSLHYFLMIFAGVTLYGGGAIIKQLALAKFSRSR